LHFDWYLDHPRKLAKTVLTNYTAGSLASRTFLSSVLKIEKISAKVGKTVNDNIFAGLCPIVTIWFRIIIANYMMV